LEGRREGQPALDGWFGVGVAWRSRGLVLAARRPTACVRRGNWLDVLEMKDDVHDEVEGEL
jgi:hypothetical protein